MTGEATRNQLEAWIVDLQHNCYSKSHLQINNPKPKLRQIWYWT